MSKGRVTFVGIVSFVFLACACPAALAQLFTPEQTLVRVHAYEGDPRPATQIATVFVPFAMGGLLPRICKVDGRSLFRLGWTSSCPLVVYLLPGTHQLTVEFRSGWARASPTIPIRAEAGKTYTVLGTTSGEKNMFGVEMPNTRIAASISAMPEGFALTYKDIYPTYYSKGDKPNLRINPEDAK